MGGAGGHSYISASGEILMRGKQSLAFHIVDVFAVEPLSGNPLAVVEGGEDLPLELVQRIAREFNQSETTFMMRPTQATADWRLRSFTAAGAEVFGAGHNALGAWWWLAESGKLKLGEGLTVFHQEIGDRVLPVTVSVRAGALDFVSMEQEAPVAGQRLQDLGPLAIALGLTVDEFAPWNVPCQVVFTGAAHLLVPIRNRDSVDRIRPSSAALLEVLAGARAEGCYVFSLDPRQPSATAYARFFNPTVGIWEDPATGTAAGPLASHLVSHGLAASGQPMLIEQGTAMGRTSLIRAEASAHTVKIAGRGVVVATGRLFL
jgi:trans-2,3-dihydro-3-hydroxyanthranilate isomerase